MNLNNRELAAVLAGLRLYQMMKFVVCPKLGTEAAQAVIEADTIATDDETQLAMSRREIDDLCERLNGYERDDVPELPEPEKLTEAQGGCSCGSGLWAEWEHDAQNIPLCKCCDACRAEKLSKYRPEILTGYTQADVDEPIEED